MAKKRVTRSPTKKRVADVVIERFPLGDLQAADYNPRNITDVALGGLTSALSQFGLISLPVVNRRPDGELRIVGGHQRIRALKSAEAAEVDCIVVEFSDEQERKANLSLNNGAIEGTFIPEMTRELLRELANMTGNGSAQTFSALRLDALLKIVQRDMKTISGVDDVVSQGYTGDEDLPALGKTTANSKLGKMYAIGEHRLYCGKLAKVGSLDAFGVDACDVAFTRIFSNTPVQPGFLDLQLGQVLTNTTGAIYIACSPMLLPQVHGAFSALGGHWSNTIVCYDPSNKKAMIPVLYGWNAGNVRMFFGDRKQANVHHFLTSPPKDDLTVETVTRHLIHSVKHGGTVLDVCAAKGTTLIAAEKTGRRLIGYVSSAREMDRVRARWTHFVHGPAEDWKTKTTQE